MCTLIYVYTQYIYIYTLYIYIYTTYSSTTSGAGEMLSVYVCMYIYIINIGSKQEQQIKK